MVKIYSRLDPSKVILETGSLKNLRSADLGGANLEDADLGGANLEDANLGGANLRGADLRGADLGGANLRGANLRGANLRSADLRGADLGGANLEDANLGGANLGGANLGGANLRGAILEGANLPDFWIIPEEGSFIAWKRLSSGAIAKLKIPSKARRTSSLVGRKNRAEFAKVLELSNNTVEGYSIHDPEFIYRAGEVVKPDSYNDDIRVECASGIHFFITRKEAEEYN